MLGFNGGLLGVRKVLSTAGASGLWMPNEQSVARRAEIWPSTGMGTRYVRFANFADTTLNGDVLDLSEIRFYTGDTVVTGITTVANFPFSGGNQGSALTDGDLAGRYYCDFWNATYRATATISFDFGSVRSITSIEIYIYYENNFGPRFPNTFDVQFSGDGTSYTTYATLTKGACTLFTGDVFKTAKLIL